MAQSRFPRIPTAQDQWITVATNPPPADNGLDALEASFAAQLDNVELPTANSATGAPDPVTELAFRIGNEPRLNPDGSIQARPPRAR